MYNNYTVSIVIPTFNEKDSIKKFINEVEELGIIEEIVVVNNKTGFIVESENIDQCAEKLILLVKNEKLRKKMGNSGRDFVKENYEGKNCFDKVEKVYNNII